MYKLKEFLRNFVWIMLWITGGLVFLGLIWLICLLMINVSIWYGVLFVVLIALVMSASLTFD